MKGACTTPLTFDGGASTSMVVEVIVLRERCGLESIAETDVRCSLFGAHYTHEQT